MSKQSVVTFASDLDGVDALHQRLLTADVDCADSQRQDRRQHQALRHDAGDEHHRVAEDAKRDDRLVLNVPGDEDHRRAQTTMITTESCTR
ncbi:MAG: hypothetical protein U0703_11735 [Anaerolineae bacterium]